MNMENELNLDLDLGSFCGQFYWINTIFREFTCDDVCVYVCMYVKLQKWFEHSSCKVFLKIILKKYRSGIQI